MSKANNEVLRGVLSKDLKSVNFTVDISEINWRKPISISSKGNASYIFNQKHEFEVVDVDGITVPVTASIGIYLTKKDWKDYIEQVQGHAAGKEAGTNTTTSTVKYTIEQLEMLKEKGLLKEEMIQALLEKGLVEL